MRISKKLFTLLSTIIGALGTIGVALLNYFQPPMATAWVVVVGIATTAIIDILSQFVDSLLQGFKARKK